MPRNKLPEHEKKSKIIKVRVTQRIFEKYNTPKLSTSSTSPALSNSEILRKVLEQMDDNALLYFLGLDDLDPIRERFRYEYQFSNFDNKQ